MGALKIKPIRAGCSHRRRQPVGARKLRLMSANPFSKVPNGAMSSVGDKSSVPYAQNEEPANKLQQLAS